jgi:hypothetical protein
MIDLSQGVTQDIFRPAKLRGLNMVAGLEGLKLLPALGCGGWRMAGFNPRKAAEVAVEGCRVLSMALSDLIDVQRELLELDAREVEWEDWERLVAMVDGVEGWLNRATGYVEELRQQLDELKRELNRRTLAKYGIKPED